MSSSSKESLRHPLKLDVYSTGVAPSLEEAVRSNTTNEELPSQHKLIATCPVVKPNNMGSSESRIEEIVRENVFDEESLTGDTECFEKQNALLQTGANKMQCADVQEIKGPMVTADQDCHNCDRPEKEPISTNETLNSKEVVEPVNLSSPSDISESTRNYVKVVETGEMKGDKDELENRLDNLSPPSSVTGCSPLSFFHSEIEQVEESLMRAMILKYFSEHKSDSDNSLPAYYVSEEKYEKLWLECPEASEMDSCEHKRSSSRFSQLCASNFIQLGASLIGYPASSWFENKSPESPAHLEKSIDFEHQDRTPMRVQIWITEKSHPTPHDVKNDIFLKMCAVEEMNRSDLMRPHRAYLTADGSIEFNLNVGNQKEGIADFIDDFQLTQNFGLNRKKYSPSWKSVIDALSRTPHYVNSEQAMSDSKSKYRYRGKRGGHRHKKNTSNEGLSNDKTDFCDKSTGQTPEKTFEHDTYDIHEGTDADIEDLNHGASAVELTGNERLVDLDIAFSESSVNNEPSESNANGSGNRSVDSPKNDVSVSASFTAGHPSDGMLGTIDEPLDSSKLIHHEFNNDMDEKYVTSSEGVSHDLPGRIHAPVSASIAARHPSDGILETIDEPLDSSNLIQNESNNEIDEKYVTSSEDAFHDSPVHIPTPELAVEMELRNSPILNSLINDVLVVAEDQVRDGIQGSSGTVPSADPTSHTSAVMEPSLLPSIGKVEQVSCALPLGFTETPVDHEPISEADEVALGIEDIRVDEASLSETDDSQGSSVVENSGRNWLSDELVVSMKESRSGEESEEVNHVGPSADHPGGSSEETVSSSGSSSGTESEDEEVTYSKLQSTDHSSTAFRAKEHILRNEKIELSYLPNSLRDIGLQVFHPRGYDVVSRLSKFPDTHWLAKAKHTEPAPINVISSSESASSTLMKALEKTCSKLEGNATDSRTGKDAPVKPKAPKIDATSAQNTSLSGCYVPPWKRVQASKKDTKPTNEESGESSISRAKLEVVEQLIPTETGKDPSISAKRSGDSDSSGKVANDEAPPVLKSLPSYFGKLPSTSQGFARHAFSDPTNSRSELLGAVELQAPTGSTLPGLSSVLGATRSKAPVLPAGPSSHVVPAPPLGAFPVRPPLLSHTPPPPLMGIKTAKVGSYSNKPDEFGRFVAESLATMSPEQRTHAVTIIWDVLTEGNNKTLCQYTRLSGVMNGREGGKEVFRMGPSHTLEAQHSDDTRALFPRYFRDIFPRSQDPPKEPSLEGQRQDNKSADPKHKSQNSLPIYKTPASDQKLPMGSQNVAPNQSSVPPTENKPPKSLKKMMKYQKYLAKKAVLEHKTSQAETKTSKKSSTNAKPSSAKKGTSANHKIVVETKLTKMYKAVQNQQAVAKSAAKSQNPVVPSQNPVPKASSTSVDPAPKTQNPTSTSQKSASKKKKWPAAGDTNPASEESDWKKKRRIRKAFFCPNKANP